MSNLVITLREEIRRLARREIKSHVGGTKQAVAQYRREIARLKREQLRQGRKLTFLEAQERKRLGQPQTGEEPPEKVRFSARSVRAQRKRLKLSAESYARLLGISAMTLYNWEHGRTRPGKPQFAALISLRGIGKRKALKRLELLADRAAAKARPRKAK